MSKTYLLWPRVLKGEEARIWSWEVRHTSRQGVFKARLFTKGIYKVDGIIPLNTKDK